MLRIFILPVSFPKMGFFGTKFCSFGQKFSDEDFATFSRWLKSFHWALALSSPALMPLKVFDCCSFVWVFVRGVDAGGFRQLSPVAVSWFCDSVRLQQFPLYWCEAVRPHVNAGYRLCWICLCWVQRAQLSKTTTASRLYRVFTTAILVVSCGLMVDLVALHRLLGKPPQSYVTSPAIWDHTVCVTFLPTQVIAPRLNPSRFTYLDSWVDLGVGYIPIWFTWPQTVNNHLMVTRPRVEPRTS